jgi:hypothetical protein
MSKRARLVLAAGCGIAAVSWAAFNLSRAFGPDVVTDRPIAYPSNWVEVPELVLVVVLIVLLRMNVALAPLAARGGKAAVRCRIAHFWVTVGYMGAAVLSEALVRFWLPLDSAVYAPPPVLAVLEASVLPLQVLFVGCLLTVRNTGDAQLAPNAPAEARRSHSLVRKGAAALASPLVGECVVTFLVAALLSDAWWNWVGPDLKSHVVVGGLVAGAVAFIAATGSPRALALTSSVIAGIVAGTTWVFWTFPNDTGRGPIVRVVWFVLAETWQLIWPFYAGAVAGAALGVLTRRVFAWRGIRLTAR